MNPISQRLARAKSMLFGTAAADIPTPFEISCDCGHRVAGIRRPRIQIVACSACGNSIFVLPVNLYPATRRKPSLVVDKGLTARAAAAARELAGTTAPPPLPAKANSRQTPATPDNTSTRRPPRQSRKNTSTLNAPADTPNPNPASPTSTEPPLPQRSTPPATFTPFTVRIRRLFSPFRLLAAGCLALLLLTAAWMIRQQQLDNARRTWRREMDAARIAEAEHNRPALLLALKNALAAADTLNRQDPDALSARALLQQCEAIGSLAAVDPVEVLTTAASSSKISQSELDAALRGLNLLFDAVPQFSPETPNTILIDLPLIIQNRLIRISATSPTLLQFAQQHPGQSALFLAAIRSCQLNQNPDNNEILIELDPRSLTLLTSEFLANEAGLNSDNTPELTEILKRQTALLTPESRPHSDSAPAAADGNQPKPPTP